MKIKPYWLLKTVNILNRIPKCIQMQVTEMFRDVHMTDKKKNPKKYNN